jgi:hypothetical protein
MTIKFTFGDGSTMKFHTNSRTPGDIYDLIKKHFHVISVNDTTLTDLFTEEGKC